VSARFPYFADVPRQWTRNLEFRLDLIRMARTVPGMKETLLHMCSKDMCFMLAAFGWTVDQRDLEITERPFVPWDYQVDAFADLQERYEASRDGRADCRIKKSRDMGASWICLAFLMHRWMFDDNVSFLLVSRNEDYVDSPGDPSCLFWKLDYMLSRLPGFLRPDYDRTKLRLGNAQNGASIVGESTTGNVARGARFTAIMLDEFAAQESAANGFRALAATRDATRMRIFNSTLGDPDGAYAQVLKMPMKEIVMPWHAHPQKRAGLYRCPPGGTPELIDGGYRHPPDYKFVADGKVRSPWYDGEEKVCANRVELAREIDMDEIGATYTFFEPQMVSELIREHARPPDMVGELAHDPQTGDFDHFVERPGGRLHLWFRPDMGGLPPEHQRYAVGCDVATGTGASNTAISVGCAATGRKMAELVDPNIQPHEAGVYAVALARWFWNATLIWENAGPGRNFGIAVVRTSYRNIWYERNEKTLAGVDRPRPFGKAPSQRIPGWSPNNKEARQSVYYEYRQALKERKYVNYSKAALEECLQISYGPNGIVINSASSGKQDPTGAKDNHGDRPTADALSWKAMGGSAGLPPPPPEIRPGSLAWRIEQDRLERSREREEDWT